ncbi:hypothetical protein AALO_G00182080 [Alosa alosa]|uniref:FXYD domain-containing ion transport regulator n=1 Tax=Alosa alosa TaxID=278164 RepID=A0AAV6GCN8_9TELE|nr:hypothetical protein AALO_G00182080 [Alosa alosa]
MDGHVFLGSGVVVIPSDIKEESSLKVKPRNEKSHIGGHLQSVTLTRRLKPPERISPAQVIRKMEQFSFLFLLGVFYSLFIETEASPFVYDYYKLRVGGLVFAGMLVTGAVVLLMWNRCRPSKKGDDDSEI